MTRMRLSIGGKLGISAALGVLLACVILAVVLIVTRHAAEIEATAERQEQVHALGLAANVSLGEMIASTKDVRLAYSEAEIGRLGDTLKKEMAEAERVLKEAAAAALDPTDRMNFEKLATYVGEYGRTSLEIVAARQREIGDHASRDAAARQWAETAKRAHDVLEAAYDSTATEGLLDEFDRAFQTVRSNSWKFIATHDEALLATIDTVAGEGTAALKQLSDAVAGRPESAGAVASLGTIYTDYVERTRSAIRDVEAVRLLVEEKSLPMAAEANKLFDETLSRIRQRVAEASASAAAATRDGAVIIFGTIGLLVLAQILSALYAGLGIARPIARMTQAMTAIAGGDLATAIPSVGRRDEIGDQAAVLATFRDGLAETERLRAEQARLEAEAAAQRKAEMHALADTFEKAVGEVVEMVSSAAAELHAAAETLSSSAEDATGRAAAVASAAQQAAANVQTVAAAVEELAASSGEIGQQVQHSAEMTSRAVAEAEKTNGRMSGLQGAAVQVGTVVGLIDEIAAQTNLLALNATIESARAGEAGKGFAVVAAEVKDLAGQTARATADISAQIDQMHGSTTEVVAAIGGIGRTIAEIDQIAAAIGAAVEEQNATTNEVARNVQQAAQGTQEVTENITRVADAAASASAASVQVMSSAGELSRQAAVLRDQVRVFLETVRAA